MKIIKNKKKLIKILQKQKNVGFVPTMGCIHSGHISLIKKSILYSDVTVVSIFVNKPQFNNIKDYNAYPRNFKKDILKLKKYKIDYLFLPTYKEIYPKGPNKKIKVDKFSKNLCGKFRPGHFEGVVDVIDRFIKIINPNKIFLGIKDLQQSIIIEKYLKKNKVGSKIIHCNTIREKNGLAISSRNILLNKPQKKIGSKVFRILSKNKKKIIKNKLLLNSIIVQIKKIGVNRVDYLKLLNTNSITSKKNAKKKYKIFIAYYIGSVRLIDNI